ncbi:hypothetical protein DL93DRAFT_2084342 [Clavulina sp. PMI_390]|nr:hypothetical protein DL93DRAFT_2084342 [Clavulina sp. PMI_390]
MLWSTNQEALEALAQPDSIELHFARNEVYGPDSLAPRTASCRNRRVTSLHVGKVWRVVDDDDDEGTKIGGSPASSASSSITLGSDEANGTGTEAGLDFGAVENLDTLAASDDWSSRDDLYAQTSAPESPSPMETSSTSGQSSSASTSDDPIVSPPTPSVDNTTLVLPTPDGTPETPIAENPSIPSVPLRLEGPIRLGPKPRPSNGFQVGPSASPKHTARPLRRSPLAQLAASAPKTASPLSTDAGEAPDDLQQLKASAEGGERPPSPTPSAEDLKIGDGIDDEFPGEEEKGMVIHLRGEVKITNSAGLPSFNYKYLNRNVSPFSTECSHAQS